MALEIQKEILEKTLTPKLGELGNDQYIFVMYDVKHIKQNEKWYVAIVVNMMVSLIQNVFYVLVKRTGVSLAKYIYPRFVKAYLSQLPLHDVLQVAEDLSNIGNPQTEIDGHLQIIIEAQLQLLNPHLDINDARGFLNTLGQQVIDNPPTQYNI
jgi:hypothetical protein